MKELKPVRMRTKDYDSIEARIKRMFRELIYFPLLKDLKIPLKKLTNAKPNALLEALKSGRITFKKGKFVGKFSASISKQLRDMGAQWDKKTSSFKLNKEDLTYEIREIIRSSDNVFRQTLASIDQRLEKILPEKVVEKIKVADLFDSALFKVERDIKKTLKNITIFPELSAEQRAKIAEEWQNNMDLWIKDFTEKEIKNLRKRVMQAAFEGNRYESLIKSIQSSYNVTANKAKFLARQETNLLVTKYKETRYIEAGVNYYKWACVKMPHDKSPNAHIPGNVRYAHGILEGKIFRWDDPPITSNPGEPVKRNNAGTDYNCRCFAIPVVKF